MPFGCITVHLSGSEHCLQHTVHTICVLPFLFLVGGEGRWAKRSATWGMDLLIDSVRGKRHISLHSNWNVFGIEVVGKVAKLVNAGQIT